MLLQDPNGRRAEALRDAQRELLQMIARNAPQPDVLRRLCELVQAMEPESRCSVLLVEGDPPSLRTAAAPSLPPAYSAAIDGEPVGPAQGSCGTAAWRGEAVIVEDIATDPLWVGYRGVALSHGLKACWSTPVFGAGGQVLATFAVYYDTPRRPAEQELTLIQTAVVLASVAIEHARAEEKLKESWTKLELAQSIARLGYWEREMATDRMYFYGETNSMLGLSPSVLVDRAVFFSHILEEDRRVVLEGYEEVKRGQTPGPMAFRVRRTDGSIRYLFAQRKLFKDAAGAPVKVVGTLQDVTDQRQTELRLQQYLSQLAFLAEAARKVNSILSMEELLQVITDSARALVDAHVAVGTVLAGDTRRAALQRVSLSERYAACAQQGCRAEEALAEVLAEQEEPLNNTRRAPRKAAVHPSAGSAAHLLPQILACAGSLEVPVITGSGRNVGVIRVADKEEGEFTPNDERVLRQLADLAAVGVENARLYAELEDRVQRRTQELEHSNRELEAFSYSVSHDLRGPLRAIAGFAGLLRERHYESLDAESRRFIDRIVAGTDRMSNLIDDLLELGRVTRAEIRHADVDLSALATAIVGRLREQAPERAVDVTVEPDCHVRGDPRLMEIVLENLLDNAWKFTGGRQSARIRFGRRSFGHIRAFFVEDNGVGFDLQYASNLFGVFQRLHATVEFPGTGVGLATVQRIIRRHGGRIWAEAQVDRGATFYFTLTEG